MANIKLNPEATDFINTGIRFDPKAKELIKATVIRYSKDGSCWQKLKNFFLSIFCSSDWQKTKRMLKNRELKDYKVRLLRKEGSKTEAFKEIMSKVKKQTDSLMNAENECLLKYFVKLQNNKIDPGQKAKVGKYFNEIENKLREIDPRLVEV